MGLVARTGIAITLLGSSATTVVIFYTFIYCTLWMYIDVFKFCCCNCGASQISLTFVPKKRKANMPPHRGMQGGIFPVRMFLILVPTEKMVTVNFSRTHESFLWNIKIWIEMTLVHIFSNIQATNTAYWAHTYVSLCDFSISDAFPKSFCISLPVWMKWDTQSTSKTYKSIL